MLLSIMGILHLVTSVSSLSSHKSPSSIIHPSALNHSPSARQSPADISSVKTFGLRLTPGSLPQLWANTSAVSTWAAVAGNLALVLGGLVLGHRLADRGGTGEEEEAGDI